MVLRYIFLVAWASAAGLSAAQAEGLEQGSQIAGLDLGELRGAIQQTDAIATSPFPVPEACAPTGQHADGMDALGALHGIDPAPTASIRNQPTGRIIWERFDAQGNPIR